MKKVLIAAGGVLAFVNLQVSDLSAQELRIRINRFAAVPAITIECSAEASYAYSLFQGNTVTNIGTAVGVDRSETGVARFILRTDTGAPETFYRIQRQGFPSNDLAHLWISAAGSHSAALKRDGTLWTWGYNHDGAL